MIPVWRQNSPAKAPRHGQKPNSQTNADSRDSDTANNRFSPDKNRKPFKGKSADRNRDSSKDRVGDRGNAKPAFQNKPAPKPVKIDPDSPFAKLAALKETLKNSDR